MWGRGTRWVLGRDRCGAEVLGGFGVGIGVGKRY